MKLYHFPISPNSRRVIAVLEQLELTCERHVVDLSKGEQLHPDFVTLNPNHMIPTLVDEDFVLWESNAIMQYLCAKVPDNSLWSTDPQIQAKISSWQFWQAAHFGGACGILIWENFLKQVLKRGDTDQQEVAKGEERFHRFASVLEQSLQGRDWLVGDTVTLADFSVGSYFDLMVQAKYPMTDYVEIKRWYHAIEQLPAWQRSSPAKLG